LKKLLVVLAALALLAGSARAANNVQDMGAYKINASTKQIVDGSGNAKVVDADRDRDLVVSYDGIINKSIATQAVDSSAVYYTGNANRLYLYVRVTGFTTGGSAIKSAKLAIRVRSHLDGVDDSLSTYIWDPSPVYGAGVDSLIFGAAVSPTNATVNSCEMQAVITSDMNTASVVGAQPHTLVIPLRNSNGDWYWGEYTSVYVRPVSANNSPLTYYVSLRGRP